MKMRRHIVTSLVLTSGLVLAQAGYSQPDGGHDRGADQGRPSGNAGPSRPDHGRPPNSGGPSRPDQGSNRPPTPPQSRPPQGRPPEPPQPPQHGRPPVQRPDTGRPPVHRPGMGRPPSFHPIHGPVFRYPHGYRYRRWSIGGLLPAIFLSDAYIYSNYGMLGVGPPPPGTYWVRYGPDLLLVQRRTHRIVDVIYGAFL